MILRLPVAVIQTGRLILRPLQTPDLELVALLNADPEVRRFIGRPLTREESDLGMAERMSQVNSTGLGPRAIVSLETRRLIGWCGVQEFADTSEPELFYGLDRLAWGHGYATEAAAALVDMTFGESDAAAIVAIVESVNRGSTRVLSRLGFEPRGEYSHPDRQAAHELFSLDRASWRTPGDIDAS